MTDQKVNGKSQGTALTLSGPQAAEQNAERFRAFQLAAQDAELALLGAALVYPDAMDAAAPFVATADFSDELFGLMWGALLEMRTAGTRPTPTLLAARISAPEVIERIRDAYDMRPMELVARMAASATTVVNAPDYAKLVREFRNRRELHVAGERLQAAMWDPSVPFVQATSEAVGSIEVALNSGIVVKRTLADQIAESMAALAVDFIPPGVTTGLTDLDKMVGGLVPGDLWVAGGRPSMGKSTLGLGIAMGSAMASYDRVIQRVDGEPWGVLVMTHEMTHLQTNQRFLTDLAFRLGDGTNPVTYDRFRPAPGVKVDPLSWSQRQGMDEAFKRLPKLPLAVDGRPGMTITEVTATIRTHKKRMAARGIPLRLVIVDHIGVGKILPSQDFGGNVIHQIGEVTSSLKDVCVNEDMTIIACHQLSRANEGRENKRPGLADFRDSGHIEQDADVMIGIYRDAYYLERAKESDAGKDEARREALRESQFKMEAHVLKNRQGRVGLVPLFVHMGANAVQNGETY